MRIVPVFAFLLSTAASPLPQMTLKEGVKPRPGLEATAAVGNSVYEKFRYVSMPAFQISTPVVAQIIFAHVEIPAGAKLLQIPSGAKLKACYVHSAEEFAAKRYSGCLIDDVGNGTFDRVAGNEVQSGKALPAPVPYTETEITLSTSTENFKQVVTYLGTSDHTLRLSYREFMNDMARPAFTEDYTFPLAPTFPQPVAFKDVRLTITAVDGAGLHYRVEP